MNSTTPNPYLGEPGRSGGRGPGVFVPRHVIIAVTCLAVGVVAGVLVWLAPGVGLSAGAGVAVTGLLLALCGLWRDRHCP